MKLSSGTMKASLRQWRQFMVRTITLRGLYQCMKTDRTWVESLSATLCAPLRRLHASTVCNHQRSQGPGKRRRSTKKSRTELRRGILPPDHSRREKVTMAGDNATIPPGYPGLLSRSGPNRTAHRRGKAAGSFAFRFDHHPPSERVSIVVLFHEDMRSNKLIVFPRLRISGSSSESGSSS